MQQPLNQPKILILYGNYGEGHKRASFALAESFREQIPQAQVIVEDFLGDAFPFSDWLMRKLYLQTFHYAKSIYSLMYYSTKEMPADASIFQAMSFFGSYKLERYLELVKPDLVISTFPSITGMLAMVKQRGKVPFSLWCLLTDYVAHSQWLYKSVDRYFVPNEQIRLDLERFGVDRVSVTTTGIPVLKSFYQQQNQAHLREKFGLNKNMRTVLISAGAFGVTKLEKVCATLSSNCQDTQFVIVCGRNQKLFSKIKMLRDSGANHVFPMPFVKEMDELMQCADLFVTKAGGLSITEAMTIGVPLVLFGNLPGQEAENARFFMRSGAAVSAYTEDELVESVQHLLSYPEKVANMRASIQTLRPAVPPALAISGYVIKTFEHAGFQHQLAYKPQLSARGEAY